MGFVKSFKLTVFTFYCKEMLIYYIVDFLNIFVSVRLSVFVCLFDCLLLSYLSVSLFINFLSSYGHFVLVYMQNHYALCLP